MGGFLAGLGVIAKEQLRLRRGEEGADRSTHHVTPVEPTDALSFMNGEQCGPFSRTQVREMIAPVAVPEDVLDWREGLPGWGSAAKWRG